MILFEDRAASVLYNVLVNIPQKKFILPLNVCPIVPDTFKKANKEFVFVDIALDTLCIDFDKALKVMKDDEKVDGILFVKTFGISFDVQPFYKKIKKLNENIFIIDDMCPSMQEFDYDIENSHADMALFSSGYSKYVDIGYGGYGFVKEDDFKHIFKDKQNQKPFLEYRQKLEDNIPLMQKHKKELNEIYSSYIESKYHLGSQWNNWRFSILVDDKEKILKEIFKIDGLFASSHYPQIDFSYVDNPQQNTNTFKIHSKIVNLFNDSRYDIEKAEKTAQIVRKFL